MKLRMQILVPLILLVLAIDSTQAQTVAEAEAEYIPFASSLPRIRAGAESGNAGDQNDLGVLYENGWAVEKNATLAAIWYLRAAVQGYALSQLSLGLLYARGEGVPRDDRQAVRWLRAAADQGLDEAQAELGMMLRDGRGVAKDDREAIRFFRLAAEQGNALGQTNLGFMIGAGRGVPRDDETAYFWYLLASAQGNETATRNRDSIEQRLTPQQRASAQAAARDWQPKTVSVNPSTAPSSQPAAPAASTTPESTGTAFRIARDAFVTNHHVVEGCRRVQVDGTAAAVRGSDSRTDLALLSAPVSGAVASLRLQRLLVGESVSVAGFPLQGLLSGFQMTTGTLASLSGLGGDTTQFQITAPVQPGNSGGPVLDSAGRVVGVVVGKLDAIRTARLTGDIPQNVNFAVGLNALRAFLDASGVDYQTAIVDRPVPTTTTAQQARDYTVRVECWK
jgi:S1-C subfamily serine protease